MKILWRSPQPASPVRITSPLHRYAITPPYHIYLTFWSSKAESPSIQSFSPLEKPQHQHNNIFFLSLIFSSNICRASHTPLRYLRASPNTKLIIVIIIMDELITKLLKHLSFHAHSSPLFITINSFGNEFTPPPTPLNTTSITTSPPPLSPLSLSPPLQHRPILLIVCSPCPQPRVV